MLRLVQVWEDVPETMTAWAVHEPGPVGGGPLRRVTIPVPQPGPGEILVQVEVCAVCRTDLHLAEGDLEPRAPDTVPGHEVVGRVVAAADAGRAVRAFPRRALWLEPVDSAGGPQALSCPRRAG